MGRVTGPPSRRAAGSEVVTSHPLAVEAGLEMVDAGVLRSPRLSPRRLCSRSSTPFHRDRRRPLQSCRGQAPRRAAMAPLPRPKTFVDDEG